MTGRVLALLLTIGLSACASPDVQQPAATRQAEKPFVSAGKITIELDGGDYAVSGGSGDRIRVALNGNIGSVEPEIDINGTQASVRVQKTPHNNFHATIEVPKTADLLVHLSGGNLAIADVAGSKDVDMTGGNLQIAVDDPDQYSSVEASVNAGDLDARAFGGSKSGLLQRFTWSGHGKYTLRARLGAGNLTLRGK